MALTQKEKQELIRKARSGQPTTDKVIKPDIRSASQSVIKSQQAKSNIREGVTSIRQFQSELVAKARAEKDVNKISKPVPESVIKSPEKNNTLDIRSLEKADQSMQDLGASTRNILREKTPIGKFFFGNSEEEFFGKIQRPKNEEEGLFESIGKDIQSRGVIRGLLYENVLKTPEERFFTNLGELKKLGYESNESEQYARDFISGNTENIPEAALSQLNSVENTRKAWIFVEMLDAIPVLKAARLKVSNSFFRETITKSMSADSIVESRRILAEALPELKGTQELEDLITALRETADPVRGESLLREVADTTKKTIQPSTEAQRVFYDNGIPIIRGTETVPRNQTADAFTLRREVNDVLAGQAEQSRLSNLDIFADEMKAGAIPFNSVPEDKIKMFISDVVKDATRLRPGDRLAAAKELIEGTLEKGAAKAIEVFPKDLVRLADGTFVYAPKESLGKGVQGTLRSLRSSQQAKVAQIERRQAVSQLRKEIGREADQFRQVDIKKQTLRQREAEKLSREVTEEADVFNRELARRDRAAKAKQTLSEQSIRTKKLIDETIIARETRVAEIKAKAKETARAVSEASKTVAKLSSEAGKIPKLIAKERDKARRAIEAVRKQKRLTPKERVQRINRIRKERDANIARLAKERKTLETQTVKARAKLIEAKSKVVDKVSTIGKIQSEAKAQISTLRSDSKEIITQAKQTLKDTKKPIVQSIKTARAETPIQKARVKNTEEVSTLVDSIKESFSITAKSLPDTVPSPINPVKGQGKEVESQIIKGFQDELESITKQFKERGLSLSDLPSTHQAIGNPALMKQAFADLVADPAKVYSDFVSGVLPEGTTRAAYALALMKSDFVLSNPSRMDMVARAFFKGNTRIAQELQSIKVFGRMDYLNIVGRFSNQADALLKARGVDVEKEAKELLKRFSDEFDDLKTVDKADVVKALNSITCPV